MIFMANFYDMQKFQKEFDENHGWNWDKYENHAEMMKKLEEATLALVGEMGEFANIVKKMRRELDGLGKMDEKFTPHLREELTDIYIYLLILANLLKMDVPEEYYKKMKVNEERFKKFGKPR